MRKLSEHQFKGVNPEEEVETVERPSEFKRYEQNQYENNAPKKVVKQLDDIEILNSEIIDAVKGHIARAFELLNQLK